MGFIVQYVTQALSITQTPKSTPWMPINLYWFKANILTSINSPHHEALSPSLPVAGLGAMKAAIDRRLCSLSSARDVQNSIKV